MSDILQFPFGFWLSAAVLAGMTGWGWFHRSKGWGLPAMGVCLTVLAWYQGDAIYNEYLQTYAKSFPPNVLTTAWLQVALFALAFGVFVSFVPDWINAKYRGNPSEVEALLSGRRSLASLQPSLENLAKALFFVWLILFGVALWRTDWNVVGLLAPYLGDMAYPWSRGQIAQSWFDSLATFFGTISIDCAALFGVCAALLKPGWIRKLILVLIAVSWPSFLLYRTRNVMLTVMLPGLLAYAFLRLRNRRWLQVALLIGAFLVVDAWFKFVLESRTQSSIVSAFIHKSKQSEVSRAKVHHLGFNMFEELCWMNLFMNDGRLTPANGRLYAANLVNPIPRALWPGKPTMGLEYSLLRGQSGDDASGTSATHAVGMIGSGLINFGQLFGPVAAAFLMSLWCAFLARLDLTGQHSGHLPIYLIGLVLIFHLGRDIAFLVAYPFLFAVGLLWVWRQISSHLLAAEKPILSVGHRPRPHRRRRRRLSQRSGTVRNRLT